MCYMVHSIVHVHGRRINMKYFVALVLASVASAAKLDQVLLPPNVASAGGADAGLLTPFEPSETRGLGSQGQGQLTNQVQDYSSQRYAENAEIISYDNEINEEGFRYAYETSDGTKVQQEGQVLPGSAPEEGSLRVTGSYSYIGDDGQTYTVTYTADENGFQATGDHLPTPPPIPEAILRSLQLTDREGKYSSQKSSYDADAGY